LTIFSLAPLLAASQSGGNLRIAPTISAATDVRFAEPGVAADTHTIDRLDRVTCRLPLGNTDGLVECVASCALTTGVDMVDLV
jgi:hypothetical protein